MNGERMACWVVCGILAMALLSKPSHRDACPVEANLLAPAAAAGGPATYALKDAKSGRMVRLADFKGRYKAIYLDFFASWCAPCQKLIPSVIRLDRRLGGKGVLVVGMDVSDKWPAMQADIRRLRIPYRVLHDQQPGTLEELFHIDAVPTAIVLDGRTLQEKARWVGVRPEQERQELQVLRGLGVPVTAS